MGLIFIDGFDHQTNGFGNADLLTKWTGFKLGSGTPFGIDNTIHAFNGASLQSSTNPGANNGGIYKSFPALVTRIIIGFAFNPIAGITGAGIVFNCFFPAVPNLSQSNCGVLYNAANSALDFYDSTGTHVGSTPNGSIPTGAFNYVEMDWTFNNATGIVKVAVNGATVLTVNNINTGTYGNGAQSFALVQNSGGGTGGSHWDDLYILDPASGPYAAFLGPQRVQTLYPTANDAVQFAPVGNPSNFQNVNDVQFTGGAVDYNLGAVVTNQDTFDMDALFTIPASISAVAITGAYSESVPAGGVAMENVIISGATQANGASYNVPAAGTYGYDQDIFVDDPHTAALWTLAAVNALKAGYERMA